MGLNPWGYPPIPEQVPARLQADTRWVVWSAEERDTRDGGKKVTKVPRQPARPRSLASVNDPSHWSDFATAVRCWQANPTRLSGIGYVMTGVSGLVAIDVDGAGVDTPLGQELVDLGSYLEVSPGGKGLRCFVEGELPGPSYLNNGEGVEMYDGGSPRFLTVTGRAIDETPIAPSASLAAFYAAHRSGGTAKADAQRTARPELPDETACASHSETIAARVPARCMPVWRDGAPGQFESRSEATQALLTAMHAAGVEPDVILAGCAHNAEFFQRYLDARHGKVDRALDMLWAEIERAAAYQEETGAAPPVAPIEDFPLLEDEPAIAPELPRVVDKDRPLFITADQIEQRRPTRWTVRDYLPRGALAVLFGPPASGKSFVALDIAAAVSRGVSWNERSVEHGDVLYVAGEGHLGIGQRLEAMALHQGWPLGDLVGLHISTQSIPMLAPESVTKILEYAAECYRQGRRFKLVVVDTLNRNFGLGDENSAKDVAAFLHALSILAQVTGACVLVVHHSGHNGNARERGSSALVGGFDVRLEVADNNGARVLKMRKQKDARMVADLPFRLKEVRLGYRDENDPSADEESSAVVVWGETTDIVDTGVAVSELVPLTRSALIALRTLDTMLQANPLPAPADAREAGALAVVNVTEWRAESWAKGLDRNTTEAAAKKTFQRAKAELSRLALIAMTDDAAMAWLTEAGLQRIGDPLFN